ncbi:Serine/threonine-protein kinase [Microbotryomycetes sp. JL201]|nr:Serine/threonine-protein kinase [Microbotryomycetes sp. JL201]
MAEHAQAKVPASTVIPQAAIATSHVNCLDPSPPQPESLLAASPDAADDGLAAIAQAAEPTDLPLASIRDAQAASPDAAAVQNEHPITPKDRDSTSSAASSIPSSAERQGKPHPADLVCVDNPDPHTSPATTPGTDGGTELGHVRSSISSFEDREPTLLGSRKSLMNETAEPDVVEQGNHTTMTTEQQAVNPEPLDQTAGPSTTAVAGTHIEDTEPPQISDLGTTSGSPSEDVTRGSTPQSTATSVVNGLAMPLPNSQQKQSLESTPISDSSASPMRTSRHDQSSSSANGAIPSEHSRKIRTQSSSSRHEGSSEPSRSQERSREKRTDTTAASSSATAAAASKEQHKESSTRSRRQLGEYTLGKTLGAGSMGKVKLGLSNVTGEKVAIKIIPRYTSTAAASKPSGDDKDQQKPTASFLAKAAAKDHSKEIRTMREGSLCLLLHHPYICGMKSMILYPNHYYMVTEYVNGGQMLDYIISHGRLRERSARKFARQIGSALEYCHANSVVHRDLKIENILISKTGNIKIIDFGLSNLYSPTSHLSTFCGSLYFAAPELLNAKPYTGPEVDVWSFGIVLYVLVCGKVPFDDQSMPALHAKIKRECKHLLSRMLVTNPANRATLHEVLTHPWVVKGFAGPPSSHLPARTPLKPEEIDREIVKGMSGFDMGTEEEIYDRLIDVLVTPEYRAAVRNWEAHKTNPAGIDSEGDAVDHKDRPAMRVDGKDMRGGLGRSPTNKRFSGIGFYGKKIAGGLNAAFSSGSSSGAGKSSDDTGALSTSSSSTLTSGQGGLRDGLDPTRGFHPLISLYYLVKEKIDREKIWGPGVFASSTLSLTGPPPPPAPATAYQAGSTVLQPPLLSKPSAIAASSGATARDGHDISRVPVASPSMPLTPQPRQRATGEEFAALPSSAPDRSSAFAGKRTSFMAPSASTPTSPANTQHGFRHLEPPMTPTPGRYSQDHQTHPSDDDDIPLSTSPSLFARRFGSLLGRSSSTSTSAQDKNDAFSKGHRQRASIGVMAHRSSNRGAASPLPQVAEQAPVQTIRTSGSDVPLPSPSEGKAVARASTIGELSPNRHHRGQSMGGSPSTTTTSTRMSSGMPRPKTSGDVQGMFDEVEEEVVDIQYSTDRRQQQQAQSSTKSSKGEQRPFEIGFVGRTASAHDSHEQQQAKPVWLKGLFSVSTTTTKSTATIRADLIRVLDRLGVQYRDVKSGFECAHVPSIDLTSVGGGANMKKDGSGKGTIRRRASKLLLSSKDKDPSVDADDSTASLGVPVPGSHTTTQAERPHTSSASFGVLAAPSEGNNATSSSTKESPPEQAMSNFAAVDADATAPPVTAPVSNDMIVRFEIFIVKMPLLPGISGLQFRRIGGNAWQYQMLAKRILAELKL